MYRTLFLIFLFLQTIISFAQQTDAYKITDTLKVEELYKDGSVSSVGQYLLTQDSTKIKHGYWVNYDSDGSVKDSTLYDEDRIVEEVKFYKNGKRQRYGLFEIDHFGHTKEQRFDYHENGQLKFMARYRNEKMYGGVNTFDKDGNLVSSRIYNKGRIIAVPPEYKKLKHYPDSIAAKLFWGLDIEGDDKPIRLKNGQITLIDLQDFRMIDFAQIDGFADGYLYYSQFTLNVSHKTKTLDFYKRDKVLMSDIKSMIVFTKKGKVPYDILLEVVEE